MDRPLIKDMTSPELYALDFAKMEPGERAAFRDELHEKPGHGPLAPAAEHRIYAEAHARGSDWVRDHPEDDVADVLPLPYTPANVHVNVHVDELMGGPAPTTPVSATPPAPAQPRPDGTSPRRPKEVGL